MANISIKSHKITPFGGILHVMEYLTAMSAPDMVTIFWLLESRYLEIMKVANGNV
jgi:hypothetical protein